MKNKLISLFGFLFLFAAGCAHDSEYNTEFGFSTEKIIMARNYEAADKLAAQIKARGISQQDVLLVTTLANVSQLETSSPFGRISAEQIASRLVQLGFHVTEVKLRNTLYIQKETGEFVLSRNVEKIAAEHKANTVIAGTYAVGGNEVLISLRAVEPSTSRILGAYDYAVPQERGLMKNDEIPGAKD